MRRLPLTLPCVTLAGGLAWGAPGTLRADEPSDPKGGDPVVVDVEGAPRPRSASEVRLDQKTIAAAPHRTGSDALLLVPGFFVTQHSGEGKAHQLFVRGFDASHGQDVEVWVGGAPVNDVSNVHGQGYADLHFVMPEVIESLSAQLGPYDPRQGDFGVAATVRYGLGLAEAGFVAKGTLGLFGVKRLFLGYHPPSQPSSTFAAFEGYATDGFGPSRSAERGSLIAQAELPLGSGAKVRLLGTGYATRFSSPGVLLRDDVLAKKIDPFATYAPDQGGSSTRLQLVAEFSAKAPESIEKARWSVAPFFVHRTLRLRSNYTGALLDAVHGDLNEQANDAFTVGLTASYGRTFSLLGTRATVDAGVYARGDVIRQSQTGLSEGSGAPQSKPVDADVRAFDGAGWIDASVRPWKWLEIKGGLRLDALFYGTDDHAEGAAGSRAAMGLHASGRGTLDVLPTSGLHVLASAGNGFRSPQARSLGNGEKAPFTEVLSMELGARWEKQGVALGASAFHTRLSEDLVFTPELARNDRVPPTARTGFVVNLRAAPVPWFVASVSATFTHAEFLESGQGPDGPIQGGSLVPYAPQLVARSDLGVSPTVARILGHGLVLHAGLGASLLAGRPLPRGELGRDTLLLDARLTARYRWVEVGADGFNLLDATWFDGEFLYASTFAAAGSAGPTSLIPRRHVTLGPPLSVLFHLSLYLS